ncbi:MAG TPA: gamma-butyrobetaine dioxygenase [Alphaproteobacteria bacterium]|nr:gamma-butyrobetaine dioxygenase [Alphaproteobacteria bacterium]
MTDLHEIGTADYRSYGVAHRIAGLEQRDGRLIVRWDDGHVSGFHHLWLRDNCPCSDCVNPKTQEQVFEICDVPETIAPRTTEVEPSGALKVAWDADGHVSHYHPGWLRAHCYSDAAREARRPRKVTWGASLTAELPRFDGKAVLDDDGALLDWLIALRDKGLTVLTGVPTEPDAIERVAHRISFIRETNFGVLFDVQSKRDPNSNAYTALRLPLHTDLPTRELQPGLQFLHCLVNDAEGGDSVMVDGFRVAEALRDEAPELFETLATVPMDWHNKDRHSDYRCKAPLIARDERGDIIEIRLANFLRGPLDAPADKVEPLYLAYRRFIAMTRESRFQVVFRLNAGDLMAFDNRRALHARTAFDPATGARHLRGCYLDRDELLSRIRILEREAERRRPAAAAE